MKHILLHVSSAQLQSDDLVVLQHVTDDRFQRIRLKYVEQQLTLRVKAYTTGVIPLSVAHIALPRVGYQY